MRLVSLHNLSLLATVTNYTSAALHPQIALDEVDRSKTIEASRQSYGLPVTSHAYVTEALIHYDVPIGLGTDPAQLFNAVIDLQWADLWVVSKNCSDDRYQCRHHLRYDSSKSPTYHSNGTAAKLVFPLWPEVTGIVSTDTVTLGGNVTIDGHPFVEATSWSGYPHEYDAALGLSPGVGEYGRSPETDPYTRLPSPFTGLVNSGSLEKNIFSLLLPFDQQDVGDLSFGTVHENFHEGQLVSHPLHPDNATSWQIQAPRISVRRPNDSEVIIHELKSHAAKLSILFPHIALPKSIAAEIYEAINATAQEDCGNVMTVPCDRISELPDLVFDFAGQEIVLTGPEYIVETNELLCFSGPFCEPLIVGLDENNFNPLFGNGTVFLGSNFLKNVYSVFDWDERAVSLAKAKHLYH